MHVFVYGTLRSQALMAAVAGSGLLDGADAQLTNYFVRPMKGNVVPFIARSKGAVADGTVWRNLSKAQIARLDLYEAAFGYDLQALTVMVSDEELTAHCYMPPPGILAGTGDWSLADWEAAHLTPAVLAATELFEHRPLPDPGALRRMWPMIEARAWSKHRAMPAPAGIRHDPAPGDISVRAQRPPAGSFFRLQSLDITHRRFDGTQSHVLVREAFVGVDAAIVLPYDPQRDRVLMVEQFRMGPLVRQDPNPWMLEPVAGIVDARETPAEAALREAGEEAGLTLRHLEPASNFYASPGASTDYFYSFVGLCDLPAKRSYRGGVADEGEDLRLHTMSFDAAMALADTGEIATGPLILLLNWLARHRDRLRAMA